MRPAQNRVAPIALLLALAWSTAAAGEAGPRFRADGPNADQFGRAEGYPHCTALDYVNEWRCRVGALSHFDKLFPVRAIAAPAAPSPLRRAAAEPEIRYRWGGEARSIDDYLDRHAVSGLL